MARNDDVAGQRRFLTFPQLLQRWGGISHMTLEGWLKKNADFPKIYQLPGSRLRLFDLEEVEAYERKSVRPKRQVA